MFGANMSGKFNGSGPTTGDGVSSPGAVVF